MSPRSRLSKPIQYDGSSAPLDQDVAQVADGFGGGLMGLAGMVAATEPAPESVDAIYERNYGALVDLQSKKADLRKMQESNSLDAEQLRVGSQAATSQLNRVTASIAAIKMASAVELQGMRAAARLALKPYEQRFEASTGNPAEAAFHGVRESQHPQYMNLDAESKKQVDNRVSALANVQLLDIAGGMQYSAPALVRELDSAQTDPERKGELAAAALDSGVPESVVGERISTGALSMGLSLRDMYAYVPPDSRVTPAAVRSAESRLASLRSQATALYGVTWKPDGSIDETKVSENVGDGYARDLENISNVQADRNRVLEENKFLVDPAGQRLLAAKPAVERFIARAGQLDVGGGSRFVQLRAQAFQEHRGIADPKEALRLAAEERTLMGVGTANAADLLAKSIQRRREEAADPTFRQAAPTKAELEKEFREGLVAVSAGESGTLLFDEGMNRKLGKILSDLGDNPTRVEADMARSRYENEVLLSAVAIGTTYFTAMEQANGAGQNATVARDFFKLDDIRGVSARAEAARNYEFESQRAVAGGQPTMSQWRAQWAKATEALAPYSGTAEVSSGEKLSDPRIADATNPAAKVATRLSGRVDSYSYNNALDGGKPARITSLQLESPKGTRSLFGGRMKVSLPPELAEQIEVHSRRNSSGSLDSRPFGASAYSLSDVLEGGYPIEIKQALAAEVQKVLDASGLSGLHSLAQLPRADGGVDYKLMTAPEAARLPGVVAGTASPLAALSETPDMLDIGRGVLENGPAAAAIDGDVARPGMFATVKAPSGTRVFAADIPSFVKPRAAMVAASELSDALPPEQISEKLGNLFVLVDMAADEKNVPAAARIFADPAGATFASYQLEPARAGAMVRLAAKLPEGDPSRARIEAMAAPYKGLPSFERGPAPAPLYGAFLGPDALVLPSIQAAQRQAAQAAEAAKKAATPGGAPPSK